MSRLSGMRAWLVQRFSAVYMLLYLAGAWIFLATQPGEGYVAWRGLIAHPVMGVASVLLLSALLLHAWVGMRDVVLDYIRPLPLRLAALALVAGWLLALGIWLLRIVGGVMVT